MQVYNGYLVEAATNLNLATAELKNMRIID